MDLWQAVGVTEYHHLLGPHCSQSRAGNRTEYEKQCREKEGSSNVECAFYTDQEALVDD